MTKRTIIKPVFKAFLQNEALLLPPSLEELIVELLVAEGLLSIKELYTDGTKIEANANRYSFVWGNAIKTNKEKMARQLETMWQYAQSIADKELQDSTPTDFKTINAQKVKALVEKIDAAIKDKPVSKTFKQKLNYVKKTMRTT